MFFLYFSKAQTRRTSSLWEKKRAERLSAVAAKAAADESDDVDRSDDGRPSVLVLCV